MARKLEDLETKPNEIDQVKDWAMEIMQYIFSESQKNLSMDMPWGDSDSPNVKGKKPSTIWYTGDLARSTLPPQWEGDKIVFEYTAPYSRDVEFGSPPHDVDVNALETWVRRKLGVRNQKAARGKAKRIRSKIARDGVLPHPYLRPAISAAIRRYNLKIKPIRL